MSHKTRLWRIRHFVTRFVNPITRRFAQRLPGFALLTFRGRVSGKNYSTPVNVFRRGNDYIFVLTYGSDADWVKNVLAAGECWMQTQGRTIRLTRPEILVDPTRSLVPAPVRWIGRLVHFTEFLRMRPEPDQGKIRFTA